MKIQDILFFIVFASIMYIRKPRIAVLTGIACLLASIPLFSFWVFFTAERLTWYATAFFLSVVIMLLFQVKEK